MYQKIRGKIVVGNGLNMKTLRLQEKTSYVELGFLILYDSTSKLNSISQYFNVFIACSPLPYYVRPFLLYLNFLHS